MYWLMHRPNSSSPLVCQHDDGVSFNFSFVFPLIPQFLCALPVCCSSQKPSYFRKHSNNQYHDHPSSFSQMHRPHIESRASPVISYLNERSRSLYALSKPHASIPEHQEPVLSQLSSPLAINQGKQWRKWTMWTAESLVRLGKWEGRKKERCPVQWKFEENIHQVW